MGYQLEGQLLEVCTCKILCPCWVGEDPDGGTCDGVIAYNLRKGTVNGVDVSNLVFAALAHIPGNVLHGNWRVRAYVDARANPQQKDAILAVFTGKLGGPCAEIAKLIGEVLSVEQVPIHFEVDGIKGSFRIGAVVDAALEPYVGATGQPTTLRDTIFSTISGSPAYVGKASQFRANAPGLQIDLRNHNAISGSFLFAA